MREIKFKAWDNEEKHLIPFDDIYSYWKVSDLYPSDFIIMQYTGLKDKNGKEIYEGDWFKSNSRVNPFMIIWYNGSFRGKYPEDDGKGFHIDDYETKCGEVIGNIYESKHLLDNIDTKV